MLNSNTPLRFDFCNIIGRSPSMHALFIRISKVAQNDSTVLITGPTGTGKNLVARAIHTLSRRKNQPIVTVNCAAFPEQLLESELFGHCRGAFTGAGKDRFGRFQQANGGTLFLDEVGEMPPAIQVKLLHALQFKTFERVGENKPTKVDIRIVAATHRDLKQGIADGWFREDLYYRLNVIPISIPPLKERKEDIPLLVRHLLNKFSRHRGKGTVTMSKKALQSLMAYPFPGNVRELENIIERVVVLGEKDIITRKYISDEIPIVGKTNRTKTGTWFTQKKKLFDALRDIHITQNNGRIVPWHQTVRCVPFKAIAHFLSKAGCQWFTRGAFAHFLKNNASSGKSKYKTAGVYLNILTTNKICIHNGKKANQSAYRLNDRFCTKT